VGNGTTAVLQPTNLHWDNTNSRLGIGTTNPQQNLTVRTTTAAVSVGLISGGDDAANTATVYFGTPYLSNPDNGMKTAIIAESIGYSRNKLHFCFDNTLINGNTYNASLTNSRMTIQPDGNVGIGTTNPLATLHVEGDIQSPVLTGQVSYFARNAAPTGWLACDGSIVSRTTFAKLFAAISTTFGAGNGSSTFGIPDLRGEFIRSWDNRASGGVDNGRVFGGNQGAAMLNHTHTGTTTAGEGTHTHTITDPGHNHMQSSATNGVNYGGPWYGSGVAGNAGVLYTEGNTTGISINSTNSAHTHTMTTGNPSAGGGAETRPRNVALLACIKY